jgi:hypothetical protein
MSRVPGYDSFHSAGPQVPRNIEYLNTITRFALFLNHEEGVEWMVPAPRSIWPATGFDYLVGIIII